MPIWRRDRSRRTSEPSEQAEEAPEERFFEEPEAPTEVEPTPEPEPPADTEPELDREGEPEPELEPAGVEPPLGAPEVVVEAVVEPEAAVEAVVEPEAAVEAAVTEQELEPAPIPPLPADPGAPEVSPAVEELVEEVPAPEPEPEQPVPAHAPAHARAVPEPNFAERAQLAMERLGDLPTSNGHKTRALPRVVAIANQKGGVGKTTTTVNLGAALSELDYRVLVVDLDPQGNATSGLGIDTRNFEASMYDVIMRDAPIEDCIEPTSVQNLFVTPATIDLAGVEIELVSAFSRELKLKRAIDTVVDDFDFVLIDCPPSLGLLTVNGLAAATEVLVPIQCEYYALEGLSQLIRNVQLVATNLNKGLEISAIVLTMFDARTRLAIDVADEVRTHFKDIVCRSIIPRTVRLSEAPSFGQPITVFDPSSRGAIAYRELAKEVSDGAPKRSG